MTKLMNAKSMIRIVAAKISVMALLACVMPMSAHADDVRTVEASYTYYGNGEQSRNQCKALALEGARSEALAKAFGRTVSTTIFERETVSDELDSSYQDYLSQTEVKGEWLGDLSEPQYEIKTDEEGNFVITCTVKGRARAITNEAVDFDAEVLTRSVQGKKRSTKFNSGDYMYVSMTTPADGYVVVYLADDAGNVFTLFPYLDENMVSVPVKKNQTYVLFDPAAKQPTAAMVDEMKMTTSKSFERNDIYVLFSPNPFSKAKDDYVSETTPRMLKLKDFNKWLINTRNHDRKMSLKRIPVEITGEKIY